MLAGTILDTFVGYQCFTCGKMGDQNTIREHCLEKHGWKEPSDYIPPNA